MFSAAYHAAYNLNCKLVEHIWHLFIILMSLNKLFNLFNVELIGIFIDSSLTMQNKGIVKEKSIMLMSQLSNCVIHTDLSEGDSQH